MPRIAVTGHMNLSPDTVDAVRDEIAQALSRHDPAELTGLSCIARGADTLFAEEVIRLNGSLEVYLPSTDYRDQKVKPDHLSTFDRLVKAATVVHVMPFTSANREAYEATNEAMLATCDQLYAVWDGQNPVDQGGTGAVVSAARSRGLPVRIFWPDGARRL